MYLLWHVLRTEETHGDRQAARERGNAEESLEELFVLEAMACDELHGNIVEPLIVG